MNFSDASEKEKRGEERRRRISPLPPKILVSTLRSPLSDFSGLRNGEGVYFET